MILYDSILEKQVGSAAEKKAGAFSEDDAQKLRFSRWGGACSCLSKSRLFYNGKTDICFSTKSSHFHFVRISSLWNVALTK
jgi:hypothetical protein